MARLVKSNAAHRLWFRMMHDGIGKGAFIREHGRDAWDALPRWAILKDGKRAYISREAYLDNIWLVRKA